MLDGLTVTNHPAYTEGEASRGVDGRDSRMLTFWDNGVECSLPYHPVFEALEPRYDQNIVRSHRHHTGPTGMQKIERVIPEDHIAAGANPYYQFIQRILGTDNVLTPETIFKRLIENYQVLPRTPQAYNMMLYIIDEMHMYGYVYREMESIGSWPFRRTVIRYKKGVSIHTDDYIYPWSSGYDPIMWHMADYIDKFRMEGCEKKRIRSEFLQNRYWLRNEAWLELYLKAMKDLGYLQEFPKGTFKLINPVQPFNGR